MKNVKKTSLWQKLKVEPKSQKKDIQAKIKFQMICEEKFFLQQWMASFTLAHS